MVLLEKVEIVDFCFYDLCYYFVSKFVMVGVDLNMVRELLGYGSFEMMFRYVYLVFEYKVKVVNKIWI